MTGQPANSNTASRTNEKTWAVEGRREASTTDAESAEVSDSDDVKLPVCQRLIAQAQSIVMHTFSPLRFPSSPHYPVAFSTFHVS